LELPEQAPIILIVDALDECLNISDIPSSHEKSLMLAKKLIEPQLLTLRICVTSRPEGDIKPVLGPSTFRSVSLHNERGQMEVIEDYIKSVVVKWRQHGSKNRRRKTEGKQLVIDVFAKIADGIKGADTSSFDGTGSSLWRSF
jgi:hypothetical protein